MTDLFDTVGRGDHAELARLLGALWNPRPKSASVYNTDFDDEEYEGCTGDGGCGCSSCRHDYDVRTARCGRDGCTAPTQYRVRAWRTDDEGTRVQAREIGRTDERNEWVTFSDVPVYLTGSERYACDKPHAYELAQQVRAHYNRPDAADPRRWRVEIERWRYEPDDYDLPHGDLPWLLLLARGLADEVRTVIDAVNPHAVRPTRDAHYALAQARRTVAELVGRLAALDTRDLPQIRYTDSIPADVSTVTTARGPGAHYINRRFPESPTSGWSCMSLDAVYDSDAALLAAHPDGLYERPRSELVLPTPDHED